MFRQIKVQEHQQDFLRILWRPSPEEDIVSYRLKTVTYRTKPAPYLATRCLLQLALKEEQVPTCHSSYRK
ncbi:hypothetical protein TNCT_554921 [Trichonephila clavata]|uniref:Uncharacterized protein n=1 Tax=Trichonephila clavata TaxID=2740835 RepID=A0A8X6G1B5_TRICU|nr:hypothetical protein TNCT_554921 [Trichonephila clavata]